MNLAGTAAQISDSLYLKFIMAFHIVTSAAGTVKISYMLWHRKTLKLLAHKSLTLLMDIHTFWTFLMCITMLVNNSITMHAHLTMRDPSDIVVTASACTIRLAPLLVTCYGSIFSQLAMAAERYRASQALSSYEKSGRTVGHSLNIIHLAATLLVAYLQMAYYGTDWTAAHCTCVRPQNAQIVQSLGLVVIVCEVVTIVTFKKLLKRNCRLRDNHDNGLTLSERFFYRSHTSLGILATVFFFIMTPIFPSPEMYPLVEETATALYLQGILMPVIFIYRFRAEQRHEQELRSMNTTRGATLVSLHTRAIVERW